MEDISHETRQRMKKAVDLLHDEFRTLRSGRASAALFERIRVDYYDQKLPLNQVATISIPEARLVIIQPWDRGALAEIEKAIQKSELSLNPTSDGKVIRINIPPLTEERRRELVKVAKQFAEQARIALRNVRRDSNEELKKRQKEGSLSEDEAKRASEDVQKTTDSFNQQIQELLDAKEKEILEV
jgi:ribosome recycling factor